MSGSVAGALTFIALGFDAFIDPIVGALSDSIYVPRLGRRHLPIFIAIAPLCITLYYTYHVPPHWEHDSQFIWGLAFLVSHRLCLALYSIPFTALASELATTYNDRTVIMGLYQATGFICGPATIALGMYFLLSKPKVVPNRDWHPGMPPNLKVITIPGPVNPENYPLFTLFVSCVSALGIIGPLFALRYTWGVKPPKAKRDPTTLGQAVKRFLKDICKALTFRRFLPVVGATFGLGITMGVSETATVLGGLFFWNLGARWLAWIPMAWPLGALLCFVLWIPLTRKMDKKPVAIFCLLLWGTERMVLPALKLFGYIQWNGWERESQDTHDHDGDFTIFLLNFVSLAIGGSGCIGAFMTVLSMLSDVTDAFELKTGRRYEGIFYSSRMFFVKVSGAAGHLIGGVALSVLKFPSDLSDARRHMPPPDVRLHLGWLVGPLCGIGAIVGAMSMLFYSLDRDAVHDIKAELDSSQEMAAFLSDDGNEVGEAGEGGDAAIEAAPQTP
eukprot:TRINITY_DN66634_c2_g1_i2.p1 TRINITY_DN66634_c2_g1~~TRINITY_DN66634_c2_g1_i2.p1  ORF type:complete len:553 (+),score=34.42 TRINITY_DN66634_c2_g1_i2:158-1660(+)